MKRFTILFTSFLIILASCSNHSVNTSSKDSSVSSADAVQKSSIKTVPFSSGLVLSNYGGCMTADGFYYLKTVFDSFPNYTIIMHLNTPSMLEIPLCNKPECKHENDTCNAFVSGGRGFSNDKIFTDGSKLYLTVSNETVSHDFAVNPEDGIVADGGKLIPGLSGHILYSMNFDGTNRTKIAEFDPDEMIQGGFITGGGKIYCVKNQMTVTRSGNGNSVIATAGNGKSELLCIDPDKKAVISLGDFSEKAMLGVYKTRIFFESNKSDADSDNLNTESDAEILKYYNSIDRKIMSYDVETKEEKTLLEGKASELESMVFGDNMLCYFNKKANKLKGFNLDTDEPFEILTYMKKSPPCPEQIIDGKLIYSFYDGNRENPQMESCFYYDFASQTNTELTLFVQGGEKCSVRIIDETDGQYLVIPKKDEEKENTWAGTVRHNTLKEYYALIKSDDYWQSKPNYKYFEED